MVALLPADEQLAGRRPASRCAPAAATPTASIAACPAGLSADAPAWPSSAPPTCAATAWTSAPCQLVRYFPKRAGNDDGADAHLERAQHLIGTALRNGDYRAAYDAAANTGLPTGADAAEAEFYAGWLALTKLNNPQPAERHFAAHRRGRHLADHPGPRPLLAGPGRRGARRYGRGRSAIYAQGGRALHHLLRPAGRREGRRARTWRWAATRCHHRRRPRPLRGPRAGARRAPARRRPARRTCSRPSCSALDDTLPTAEE